MEDQIQQEIRDAAANPPPISWGIYKKMHHIISSLIGTIALVHTDYHPPDDLDKTIRYLFEVSVIIFLMPSVHPAFATGWLPLRQQFITSIDKLCACEIDKYYAH